MCILNELTVCTMRIKLWMRIDVQQPTEGDLIHEHPPLNPSFRHANAHTSSAGCARSRADSHLINTAKLLLHADVVLVRLLNCVRFVFGDVSDRLSMKHPN